MTDDKKPAGTVGGTVTRKGRNFSPRPPRPDDKIFRLGFVIGGLRPPRKTDDER